MLPCPLYPPPRPSTVIFWTLAARSWRWLRSLTVSAAGKTSLGSKTIPGSRRFARPSKCCTTLAAAGPRRVQQIFSLDYAPHWERPQTPMTRGQLHMASELPEFRRALEEAFIAPFASHSWLSRRGRSHWVELEGWQDSMAGPLSAIANTGGCEYVYHREDWYFAGIKDPLALKQRFAEVARRASGWVGTFFP